MKVRILCIHELDGPRELLEVEALGDYTSNCFDLEKLKVGVIELVQLPKSLEIDYGEWQEFPDDVHNRSHLRSSLGKLTTHRRNESVVEKFVVEILQVVAKEMKPTTMITNQYMGREEL